MNDVSMNADTDYVHQAIINYEPTWVALVAAAEQWANDEAELPEARDHLRDAVEQAVRLNAEGIGLDWPDLTDDVDYSAMVQYEAGV